MIRFEKYWLLCLSLLLQIGVVQAQEDCKDDINYTISIHGTSGTSTSYSSNDDYRVQLSVGQPIIGRTGSAIQGRSLEAGFWGHYRLEPQAPRAFASQGEYIDRIEVEWTIVDGYSGPPVTANLTKIFRNGRLLTTIPVSQTAYVDYNVFPGEFYTYEIVTSNNNGDAKPLEVIGFLQPNGRVTGKVETRTGTPVNDVKVTLSPNLGRSLQLDGVDDYAYFIDQDYTISPYYTLEGWWRNVSVKDQTIIVAVDSGTSAQVFRLYLDDLGKLHYFHDGNADGTGVELVSNASYNLSSSDRDWHHFAAVYDTTNIYLYIDGNRVAETVTSDPITIDKIEIEIGKDGPKTYSGYFAGHLDDFRFWRVGRERSEIRRYMDITLTGEEQYLKSYWKFDEQFSDKIFDFADNPVEEREHGYICGISRDDFISPVQLGAYTDEGGDYLIKGVFYGAGTTFSVSPSKSTPIGFSLEFDGTNDFISYELERMVYTNAFTIEGWFKTEGTGQQMTIFETSNEAGTTKLLQLGLQSTGEFFASVGFDGSLATVASSEALDDEFWHHFAVVHNGSMVELFINGVLQGTTSDSDIDSVSTRMVIGRSDPIETNAGSEYFDGLLDEIRIWNYARTSTQIDATRLQTFSGNEQGIVDEDGSLGLKAYWKLGEGQGSIISDATPNGFSGDLINFQTQTIDGIELIANWNGDDIPLDGEFFEHDFDPNGRNVSLDPSNTSVDRVDFTDISQIGISGFVKFSNTDCFAPDVELKINGSSLVPPVFTDKDGKFILEIEPGTSSAFMTADFEGFDIDPGFIELPRIVRPIAGLKFDVTTTRILRGSVVGGECSLPIGGGTVTISANNGCFEQTTEIDTTDGSYEFTGIPPLAYNVSVAHNDFFINEEFESQGGSEVNLIEVEADTIDFVYYSPTQVRVEILRSRANDCGVMVNGETAVLLNQNHEYDMKIELFQNYSGGECILETGIAYINDGISLYSPKDTIEIIDYQGLYKIKAGSPNISNPYTKQITVQGVDALGIQAVTSQDVVVLGFKTLESTFETTTPDIPFLILRDPPGDGSYAYLEEGNTLCNSFSFEKLSSVGNAVEGAVHMGPDFEFEVGFFFSNSTVIDATLDLEFTSESTNEYGMTFENEVCLTNSTIYSTSEEITGEDGDVFVGGALNVLIGTNRLLELNEDLCTFVIRDEVAISPTSFATTYVYNQAYIKSQVIPDLRQIGNNESADMWEEILDYNEELKTGSTFSDNVSFSAGTTLERATTNSQSAAKTISLSQSFASSVGLATGLTINGLGFSLGTSTSSTSGYNRSDEQSNETIKTVGYVLTDDDPEDNFTVDIKKDATGMPVFNLQAGESVCPWEPGTQTRAEVQLTPLSPTSQVNVPEDEAASFQFAIGNISETAEDGFYSIRVIQDSNPDGAVIKVNGIVVEDKVELYVRASQSSVVTVTVEKGPTAFEYPNLEIEAFVGCELDRSISVGQDVEEQITESEAGQAPWFFDRQTISVEFTKTCSDVEIQTPEPGWVINSLDENTKAVVITGYDLDLPELQDIRLQYREKGDGNPFINSQTLTINDTTTSFWSLDWDVSLLSDGIYELRAVSQCIGDFLPGISDLVEGTLDRTSPVVLGIPSPVDDVLGPDDVISIKFEENLSCENIISLARPVSLDAGEMNNVALFNSELGVSIEATVSCIGNELFVVPDIQNKFIEGRVLRVDLLGLEDQFGNKQEEMITWEFLVNRNPLEWIGGDIQSVFYEGESNTYTRQIKNNGAFSVNVNLSGALDVNTLDDTLLPSWISASPRSFTLQAGATQDVVFVVSDQISGGQYSDVLVASTSFGAPELRFDVRVLCKEPNWAVDASKFENSMTFTGQLNIRGDFSTDEFDRVAAFVGNELRGVGYVSYSAELDNLGEHPYLVFMTLYTNSTSNEMIEFQVWDASRCQLYGRIAENYEISLSTSSLGSPTSPKSITVTNEVIQEIPLSAGWNWFSLNLNSTSSSTNQILSSLKSNRGDIIKSQDNFSQFVPGLGWVGPLSRLDSTQAFRIRLVSADTLVLLGEPVDFESTTIQLDSGWNWISFLPPVGMELDEALTGINATSDFIIKSQTKFAQFVENVGWLGSLDFMRPNEGYLIYSDRSASLNYPVNNANSRSESSNESEPTLPDGWTVSSSDYEFNSNLIVNLEGLEVTQGDFIGLFKSDQLVGWGQSKYVNFKRKNYFFVTAYSNDPEDSVQVRFFLSGREVLTETKIEIISDQVLGTIESPLNIYISEQALGFPFSNLHIELYPNPTSKQSILSFYLTENKQSLITVHDLSGKLIHDVTDKYLEAGYHEVILNNEIGGSLKSGLYLIRINLGGTITTKKLEIK